MAKREIISIDEALCDGCGQCVPACAEGAIQLIDGKARLVSEVYCDGLGACLGHCPQGAISVIEREAPAFDAAAVEAHLGGREAAKTNRPGPLPLAVLSPGRSSCPGSRPQSFGTPVGSPAQASSVPEVISQLRQWPVQLHLLPPTAPFLAGAEVLLAADCVAFAMGDFHSRFLAGRALAIACPKLDTEQESYLHKLVAMIDEAEIASLTAAVMEVPCCGGMVRLAKEALARAKRRIPLRVVVVGIKGEILSEQDALTA